MFTLLTIGRNGRVALGIAIVLILVGGYGYWRYHPRRGTVSFQPRYQLVLKDYNGKDVRLSQFKREILVAHSWATWCTYCGEELKNLAILKKKYGDRITIIAPNRAESAQVAKPFSDALNLGSGISFLIDPDDAFYKAVGGYAMPETLFVNDRGEVVFHQRGPMSIEEVDAHLRALLE